MSRVQNSQLHETIRIRVVELLRNILKEIFEERYRITRSSKDLIALRLVESPEIVFIVPQEIYVSPLEKKRIDMAFSNKIIFELKSSEDEFDQAVEDAKQKYLNKPLTKDAQFFIVTNYNKWRIYKIIERNKLQLEFKGNVNEARILLKQIITSLKELKLYPLPETIVRLYSINIDNILNKLRETFNSVREDSRIKPLYEAYRSIMQMLYGEAANFFFEDLFVRHTYMHMIVLASLSFALGKIGKPEDIVSGSLLEIDVALPYLNWWKIATEDQRIREILDEIVTRASLVDWEAGLTEDVFRILYEELIDPVTRRRIGEYYTPLWLVDFILEHFDLKEKTILDPFCGSGTFLVRAFHRKVDLGENIDKVFNSLLGYDINPLAVAVARAELIIAYKRRSGKEPKQPPHIYHVDTFAMWFGEEQFLPDEVKIFVSTAKNYLQLLVNFNMIRVENIIEDLSLIEELITKSLKFSFAECGIIEQCLNNKIAKYMDELSKDINSNFVKSFIQHAKRNGITSQLAKLIVKYGGNDVWGLIMASIYAPILLTRFKPDIIVTNPPWVPLTEYKAPYIDKIRNYIIDNTKKIVDGKAAQVVIGSDVATAALAKSLEIAREGVAYIMNREQLFHHKISTAGTLATYCIIKKNSEIKDIKIYDIDFDAFSHGIYPAVIVVRKDSREVKQINNEANIELYVVTLEKDAKNRYSKRLTLNEIKNWLDKRKYEKTYEEYIRPAILYFTENLDELAKALQVEKIVPKGLYIMGIYGGERKKGEESYAGLVLDNYEFKGGLFRFKLYNTSKSVEIPQSMLKEYGIKVYEMVYVEGINPFRLRRTLPILLSERSEESLRKFLNSIVKIHSKNLSSEDAKKILDLAKEVEQPIKIETLNTTKWYTIYRRIRAFTAFAFKPDKGDIIVYDGAGYLETSSDDKAHYYAAVLNYLAYKVVERHRSFSRNQYARPLLATYIAGLSWSDIDEVTRKKVVELSKILHEKAPAKEYSNQKVALKEISKLPEFEELVNTLDKVVNKEKLEEALNLVSGKSEEKED